MAVVYTYCASDCRRMTNIFFAQWYYGNRMLYIYTVTGGSPSILTSNRSIDLNMIKLEGFAIISLRGIAIG